MTTPIAPAGYEWLPILESPLRIFQAHAAAAPADLRRPEPTAAVPPPGLQLASHAMADRPPIASPASATRRDRGADRPLFSESPGEIGSGGVVVAARLSPTDWARLDASASPRPQDAARLYSSADAVRGGTVSVTA